MVASRTSRRSSEDGYSLVVLIIAVTVLNILVAAMLPLWSTAIKREKEEELIFRGFQYAEAIRVCKQPSRLGTYPTKLEQLIEVKPRCIRQLWKDPMTEDGKWALIFQNGPGGLINRGDPGGQPSDPNGRKNPNEDEEQDGEEGPRFGPRKGEEVQVGPIIGVRSKSSDKAMILLFGRERYDEWQFTETQLMGGGGGPVESGPGGVGVPAPPGGGGGLRFSTRWLGRPMYGVNQQPVPGLQDGTLPDGTTPGGNRPRQNRPGGTSKPRGLP